MPLLPIDLQRTVQELRDVRTAEARAAFDACVQWCTGEGLGVPIHEVEQGLLDRVMGFGVALLSLWLAHRLPLSIPATLTHGRASYRFGGFQLQAAHTRLGVVMYERPAYGRVHGNGPATLAPFDAAIGLAAGRMSLGVHLLAAYLAAKLPFDQVIEVWKRLGAAYVPSKRAILGIVDRLGPAARKLIGDMPVPDDDGEILVIQCDDKGAPMLSHAEHARRCKPHDKRASTTTQPNRAERRGELRAQRGSTKAEQTRAERRSRRRGQRRPRRTKGQKSKNARMAKVFVIYTMRQNGDGTLEGPLNKRVIATFGSRRQAFAMAQREAAKRGYGQKPTYFLADGSRAIWCLQQEFFPLATACLDWFHVCEYLWTAGGTVHREGSPELAEWVHERKAELLAGKVAKALDAMRALKSRIGRTGPGTKGRRERLAKAIGYLDGHQMRLRYRELAKADMDIATGAVEGAVNHVVGQRLDGSMMRWTRARSEHVLALRCVVVNGLWDHYAEEVARQHARIRDPVIPRITPAHAQEPYDAVRKAA